MNYQAVFFNHILISSPDATHPDNHTAVDVLLALWLLVVRDAEVLPLAPSEQSLARVCLCQQPRFYLIIWVDTNPVITAHFNTSHYEYLRNGNPLSTCIFETVV